MRMFNKLLREKKCDGNVARMSLNKCRHFSLKRIRQKTWVRVKGQRHSFVFRNVAILNNKMGPLTYTNIYHRLSVRI